MFPLNKAEGQIHPVGDKSWIYSNGAWSFFGRVLPSDMPVSVVRFSTPVLRWEVAQEFSELGTFTLIDGLASSITSRSDNAVPGGQTSAVLIAGGAVAPTFDGRPHKGWVNTPGFRNSVQLFERSGTLLWGINGTIEPRHDTNELHR